MRVSGGRRLLVAVCEPGDPSRVFCVTYPAPVRALSSGVEKTSSVNVEQLLSVLCKKGLTVSRPGNVAQSVLFVPTRTVEVVPPAALQEVAS